MSLQQQAQEIIDRYIASGSENGLQFCVFSKGKCIVDVHGGFFTFDRKEKIDGDTLFPVYSTTKTVAATAVNILIEKGVVSEDTPVKDIWPEFACNGKEKTLLRHLLNHSSGLPQRFPEQRSFEFLCDWKAMTDVIARVRPDWEPGTRTRYQSLTFGWVTGEIVQRITGKSFKEFITEEIFSKASSRDFYIGMDDESEKRAAEFRLPAEQHNAPRPKYENICDPLDELMRQKLVRRSVHPGFNGFASARGLANFYNDMLNERFFSRAMLERATAMHRPEPEPPTLNSWNTFGNGYALSGPVDDVGRVFGHGGFGGSDGLADQKQQLAAGFTCSVLGGHPCKTELFDLVGLVQRKRWIEPPAQTIN